MMLGGGQEKGLRSGTENVSGIVGFGMACKVAQETIKEQDGQVRNLRDMLVNQVLNQIPYTILNGYDISSASASRLPGNAHFTFLGVNGEDLIIKLDEYGVSASTGSACSVNTQKASHVLQAMGLSREHITGSLRLTVDIFNTIQEIDHTVAALKKAVKELRRVSPYRAKYGFE